jgi:multidrug resistance efflux pump
MTRIILPSFAMMVVWLTNLRADEPKPEGIQGRGVVVPARRVTLSSAVAGRIEQILIEEGKLVKKGEVLFRLERTVQELEVQRAEIHLQVAENKNDRLAIDAARVEVKRAQAGVEAAIVRAPFDGMVHRIGVEVGSYTNPAAVGLASSAGLCELIDVAASFIEVTLPQEVFGLLRAGTPCEVIIPARQKGLEGKVERIIPVIDPARATFTVRVKLGGMESLPIGATVGVRFAPQK